MDPEVNASETSENAEKFPECKGRVSSGITLAMEAQMKASKLNSQKDYQKSYQENKGRVNTGISLAMENQMKAAKMISQKEYQKGYQENKGRGYTGISLAMENQMKASKMMSQVQYHAEFEKQKGHKTSVAEDPETARIKQNTQIQSNVNYWGIKEQRDAMEGKRPNESLDDVQSQRVQPGSISDYDPMNQQHSSVVRNSYGNSQPQQYQPQQPQQQYQPPPEDANGDVDEADAVEAQAQPPRAAQPPPKQVVYRAMYDYTAADTDEVSFMDGDHIVNVEVVDAGWMMGTVQRTGKHGMLPSNYVERVN